MKDRVVRSGTAVDALARAGEEGGREEAAADPLSFPALLEDVCFNEERSENPELPPPPPPLLLDCLWDGDGIVLACAFWFLF